MNTEGKRKKNYTKHLNLLENLLVCFPKEEWNPKVWRMRIKKIYIEGTGIGTATAGNTWNPKNVTTGVNLHIEFFWRVPQFYTSKVEPGERMSAHLKSRIITLTLIASNLHIIALYGYIIHATIHNNPK